MARPGLCIVCLAVLAAGAAVPAAGDEAADQRHGLLVLEKLAYERGGLFKEQAGLTVELMREVLPRFLVVDAGDREMAVEEPGTFIEL